jgi:membrane protein implicated in regulation of membrane protease activity
MFHWLSQVVLSTTTTITFFTIFLVGVAFSAFSLILGGHGDHDADHDVGHDADHDGSSGDDSSTNGEIHSLFSVPVFSVRGIALLATGFGGIGFLVHVNTGKVLFSTASALFGGYIFAFIVLYTLKLFKAQQANSLVNMSSAIGGRGIVTVSIPEGGLGEVSMVVSGVEMFRPARSHDGMPVKAGTSVEVTRVTGGTVVVSPSEVASPGVRSERKL